MNYIPYIFKDNPLMSELTIKQLVYFFLISSASATGLKIYSAYARIDVLNKFSHYDDEDIETAIDELIDEGLILESRKTQDIQIGTLTELKGGKKSLFTNVAEDRKSENIFKVVEANHKEFMKAMKGSSKFYEVENLGNKIDKLKRKEFGSWVIADFMDLFSLSYMCMYQEFVVGYMAKQFGQMKSLLKAYDPVTVAKMIIHYTCNVEAIHKKGLPEIGLLLFHKNTVYSQIAKSKQRDTVRHTKIDDDF
jgi:hypothetical protein